MKKKNQHTRRSFLKRSLLATAGIGLGMPSFSNCTKSMEVNSNDSAFPADKNLYWGDIHNHNSIGQRKGSLERSFEIARSHLDFFCFTPQSQWPDMVDIPEGGNAQFKKGFEEVKKNWERMKSMVEAYYEPGQFVAFHGYEVHFNEGDFHIVFPGNEPELAYLPDHQEWNEFARRHKAVLVPHHPGYKPGWRGWNWDLMDPSVSPVVEICSEQGNVESDRAPIRYLRHSMGGRYTQSTIQRLWQSGVKTGIVASTDDHLGFPGAYGEGIAGVWSESLTRESVMEAIKHGRTYGVNRDRIKLGFNLNGHWMGESIPETRSREISVRVEGEDVVDRVEILRNNRVIHRNHPVDREIGSSSWNEPVLSRIEFGWGPWAGFDMARICDWEFQVKVEGGKLLSISPHLQSRPFDEQRRHKVSADGNNSYQVISYTSRQNAFEDKATNDVVLKIQGSPDTRVTMVVKKPVEMTITKTLAELAEDNEIQFTGAFSSESVMMHRIVFAEHYKTHFQFRNEAEGSSTDWYYARVVQPNGSFAWSSPIWVG